MNDDIILLSPTPLTRSQRAMLHHMSMATLGVAVTFVHKEEHYAVDLEKLATDLKVPDIQWQKLGESFIPRQTAWERAHPNQPFYRGRGGKKKW